MGPEEIFTEEDISIFLSDSAENNRLIRGVEFDSKRIGKAVEYTISRYNSIPPPIAPFIGNPANFPHKALLLKGVVSWLLRGEAQRKYRNRLPHSTGGTSVDDQGMADFYYQMGSQLKQEFEIEAKEIKIAQNIKEGFGSVSSEYIYSDFDDRSRF